MIPMLDLKVQLNALRDEIDLALKEVLDDTRFIMGPNVQEFEKEAANYLNVKHALSCNSGTDALHLALRACNIGKGDEVITTPFTFAATAESICYVGATPVFVDIDPITFNISADTIAPAITSKTKAILPVHLFGQTIKMNSICNLAKQHDLYIIEDCAQSFGSRKNSSYSGTFGNAGCFSFFPSKNLGCYGDGGLFTTNSDALAEKFFLLKSHGSKIRNVHEIVGWNSRLDEIQAAILRIKLKHIDEYNKKRILIANQYCALLAELDLNLPTYEQDLSHVFHQFTFLSPVRDKISEELAKDNIGHAIYYSKPLNEQSAFYNNSRSTELPNTIEICSQCISLPMFPEMTDSQIETVVSTVKRAYQ